jgi:hypothetical protein
MAGTQKGAHCVDGAHTSKRALVAWAARQRPNRLAEHTPVATSALGLKKAHRQGWHASQERVPRGHVLWKVLARGDVSAQVNYVLWPHARLLQQHAEVMEDELRLPRHHRTSITRAHGGSGVGFDQWTGKTIPTGPLAGKAALSTVTQEEPRLGSKIVALRDHGRPDPVLGLTLGAVRLCAVESARSLPASHSPQESPHPHQWRAGPRTRAHGHCRRQSQTGSPAQWRASSSQRACACDRTQ